MINFCAFSFLPTYSHRRRILPIYKYIWCLMYVVGGESEPRFGHVRLSRRPKRVSLFLFDPYQTNFPFQCTWSFRINWLKEIDCWCVFSFVFAIEKNFLALTKLCNECWTYLIYKENFLLSRFKFNKKKKKIKKNKENIFFNLTNVNWSWMSGK